jgi:cellulose synthase/poly-beta-1,6-N-acetylglucosamine synthase-like glycosyltransferase
MNAFIIFLYCVLFAVELWLAVYMLLPMFLLITKYLRQFFSFSHKTKHDGVREKNYSFAVIATAHQDTAMLPPLIDSLLKQFYSHYHLYVVADACDISNLQYTDEHVSILKPATDLHSKIKSIRYAIEHFQIQHDAIVVLDSDNLLHPNYLHIINKYFNKGYQIVQGNLQPKNADSDFALMDAAGDAFQSFTEREMRMELGLSSAIWGTGLAIDLNLYNEITYESNLGGFDKRIQAVMVQKVKQIAYAKDAILYDEKINTGEALQRQRTRWIHAQFKFMKYGRELVSKGIQKGNFNLFYFGYILLRPPLSLLMLSAICFSILNYFLFPEFWYLWPLIIGLFVTAFLLIVTTQTARKIQFRSLLKMPLFAVRQLLAMLGLKKANKDFLKTSHNRVIFIDDLLKNGVS